LNVIETFLGRVSDIIDGKNVLVSDAFVDGANKPFAVVRNAQEYVRRPVDTDSVPLAQRPQDKTHVLIFAISLLS